MLPYIVVSGEPTYDLERLQRLVGQGELSRHVTMAAMIGASAADIDLAGLVEVVLGLTRANFYKTMEAEKRPGLWQDVYHVSHHGRDLYIKVQIDPWGIAVIVQFKER